MKINLLKKSLQNIKNTFKSIFAIFSLLNFSAVFSPWA
jgi:hypothetical protein